MSDVEWRPVTYLCELCGITQLEAVEYLKARGVKASYGAVKAWGRGHYQTPFDAIRELYILWICVNGMNEPHYSMPPEAPEGAKKRHHDINSLRLWFNENYEDPDAAVEDEHPTVNRALLPTPFG